MVDTDAVRFAPQSAHGHFESYFIRGNHPSRPLAFWIRYTIFSAKNSLSDRFAELWALYFDGEKHTHLAVKKQIPLADCVFASEHITMAEATLTPTALQGAIVANDHRFAWNLGNDSGAPTLFLYPEKLYSAGWPRTKTLVSRPSVTFSGSLNVDSQSIDVAGWRGSHNHVWGDRQAYLYAWGQVVGFDGHPESFLEIGTARFKFGFVKTPLLTTLVLRHNGQSFPLNTIPLALKGKGAFEFFRWTFANADAGTQVSGSIEAGREDFVALRYRNPAGGEKWCLNSKIATCRLQLEHADGRSEALVATRRTAFEILTDRGDHGVTAREHIA